jgi:hypothetical protein
MKMQARSHHECDCALLGTLMLAAAPDAGSCVALSLHHGKIGRSTLVGREETFGTSNRFAGKAGVGH